MFNNKTLLSISLGNKNKLSQTSNLIVPEYSDRSRAEIDKWVLAIKQAYDPLRPRQYMLQDLYDHLKKDGHLLSCIKLRNAATLCNDYAIQNSKGEALDNETKIIHSRWFRSFVKSALSCVYYGGMLIEIPFEKDLKTIEIPRRNTLPNSAIIFPRAMQDSSHDCTLLLNESILKIDNDDDQFGIIEHLCALLIWKRNTMQSWSEYSQCFGKPMIVATSNKSKDEDISHVEDMLRQLGEAAQAVLPEGTTIDIKQSNFSDAYQVYLQFIKLCNDEISKALLGGTMITDNGASKSQSEVHERNLDEKIAAEDRTAIAFIINDQLLPLLKKRGVFPQDATFVWNADVELQLTEHWGIVKDMIDRGGEFDEAGLQWIRKRFNVPITIIAKPQPPAPQQPAMPKGLMANFR